MKKDAEKRSLPPVSEVIAQFQRAKEEAPAILAEYEPLEGMQARIQRTIDGVSNAPERAFRDTGDVRNAASAIPQDIATHFQRISEHSGGKPELMPLAEYLEMGYLEESARELVAAGVSSEIARSVIDGSFVNVIANEKRRLTREANKDK